MSTIYSPDRRPACGQSKISDAGNISLRNITDCNNTLGCLNTGVNVLTNTTQYINVNAPIDNYTSPYSFKNPVGIPNCSHYYGEGCPERTSPDGTKYCNYPLVTDLAPSGSGLTFPVGPYFNSYITSSLTESYVAPNKIGFKNAFAHKAWQGQYPFDARYYGQADYMDWCGACSEHFPDTVQDKTRYLNLNVVSNYSRTYTTWCNTYYDGEPIICYGYPVANPCRNSIVKQVKEYTSTATHTSHIDRYSGNHIIDAYTSSSSVPTTWIESDVDCNLISHDDTEEEIYNNLKAYSQLAETLLHKANSNILSIHGLWLAGIGSIPNLLTDNINVKHIGDGNTWNVKYYITTTVSDICSNIIDMSRRVEREYTIDLAAGTYDERHYGPIDIPELLNNCIGNTPVTWDLKEHIFYSYSGNTFHYTYDKLIDYGSMFVSETYHEDVTATLSSPYTTADVYQDAIELLSYLPLDDDDILPWRIDPYTTNGPVVFYDEKQYAPYVTSVGDETFSGKIYGLPAPKGIDTIWNPIHATYNACTDAFDTVIEYIQEYGAYADKSISGLATAWLNQMEAEFVMQGAFSTSFLYTGAKPPTPHNTQNNFWVGKYAEIIYPKHSINFARPCGNDRFNINNSGVRYISGITDNTITLEPTGEATTIQNGYYVRVLGTGDKDGVWTATKNNDHEIALNTLCISGSELPFIDGGSTGLIAELKTKNALNAAICGRMSISSATKTSPIILTLDQHYLINGDKVTILNASGGNINGHWTVNRITSGSIELVGSDGTNAETYITNTGQIYSQFAADWKWNDNGSKGEYSIIEWTNDFRSIGEYNATVTQNNIITLANKCDSVTYCPAITLPIVPATSLPTCLTACTPLNICSPSVAFFSPNDETFSSNASYITAVNYGFHSVDYDPNYDSLWQGAIRQTVNDPFFQAPPCPSQYNADTGVYECIGTWTQDDGTCLADTEVNKYYAAPEQLESRCEVPEGAPYIALDNCSNGCTPPQPGTAYFTPWIDYNNRIACIASGGQFATEYASQLL